MGGWARYFCPPVIPSSLPAQPLFLEPPNVAALQVLATVRSLYGFTDLHDHVAARPCADAALQLFPDFPGPIPAFIPQEWLAALHVG